MSAKTFKDTSGGLALAVKLDDITASAFVEQGKDLQELVRVACVLFLHHYQAEYLALEFEGDAENNKGGRVKRGGDKWEKLSENYKKWKLNAIKKGTKIKTPYGEKKVLSPAPMGVLTGKLREVALDPARVKANKTGAEINITTADCYYAEYFDEARTLLRVLAKDMGTKKAGGLKLTFELLLQSVIEESLGFANVGTVAGYLKRV